MKFAIAALVYLAASAPTPDSDFRKLQSVAATRVLAEKLPVAKDAIPVAVDSRIELLSIIFRVAGGDEFGSHSFKAYASYVDARFRPFAEHPSVVFARKLRDRGMSADAVASLAIDLSPLPGLEPSARFENPQWRGEDAKTFASLAEDFARKTNFDDFLKHSRPIHELAELRMRRLVRKDVDPGWFASYYGEKPKTHLRVAIGLLNGSISYGLTARGGGSEELYAVMGTWLFDRDGLPIFDDSVTATLVHEFSHPFVDAAVEKHAARFKPIGESLRPALAKSVPLMTQFYWKTLFDESLVRAVVVRYLALKKGIAAAKAEATMQAGNGFLWIEDIAELLSEYEKDRGRYPTFEQFLPHVADYFDKFPELLPSMSEKLDAKRPQIVSTSPVDGAAGVDPSLQVIQVFFDRRMQVDRFGTLPPSTDGFEFPEVVDQSFSRDGKVLTLRVRLKPNRSYELRLNSDFATGFRSAEGIPLKPYRLRFGTGTGTSRRSLWRVE